MFHNYSNPACIASWKGYDVGSHYGQLQSFLAMMFACLCLLQKGMIFIMNSINYIIIIDSRMTAIAKLCFSLKSQDIRTHYLHYSTGISQPIITSGQCHIYVCYTVSSVSPSSIRSFPYASVTRAPRQIPDRPKTEVQQKSGGLTRTFWREN